MVVRIGSARSSFGNTKAGDQNGGKEVSTQEYYVHSKGWVVIRAKDPKAREKIAQAMERACANNDIGYSQGTRNTLYNDIKDRGYDPSRTTKKVNCDCSSLVRVCCNFAGIRVGNFYTANQTGRLMATGQFVKFTDADHCKSSKRLLRGDILNTKTKGHTVVVLDDGELAKYEEQYGGLVHAETELGERILKNGCEGEDVKELQKYLIQLGYDCGSWGADGEFGDATEIALMQFQEDERLEVDGEYGPKSHARLMEVLEIGGEGIETSDSVAIVGGNCWVRDKPNTDGAKLGVAHEDDALPWLGETSKDGWHKVEYKGQEGWVSGKYSELEGAENE